MRSRILCDGHVAEDSPILGAVVVGGRVYAGAGAGAYERLEAEWFAVCKDKFSGPKSDGAAATEYWGRSLDLEAERDVIEGCGKTKLPAGRG